VKQYLTKRKATPVKLRFGTTVLCTSRDLGLSEDKSFLKKMRKTDLEQIGKRDAADLAQLVIAGEGSLNATAAAT
jgi:hypothetical protein